MDFSNAQIDSSSLPGLDGLNYEKIEKDYLKILLLYTGISNLLMIGAFVAFVLIRPFDLPGKLILTLAVLLALRLAWSFFRTIKAFPYKEFALREKDIIYKTGWLWRKMMIVPFNRVQHLQIDQGVLERQLKLAKLRIYTAGGNSSDLTIPGLRPEKARLLKQFIVAKTAQDEEE